MFHTARRPLGALALLLLLSPALAGCTTTQRIPFSSTARFDRLIGVTTRSGRDIRFYEPGATITNDTLYAVDRGGQLILPTDSIAQLWKPKISVGRTLAFTGGMAILTVGVAGAISIGNDGFFGGPH
ncbi:MAG TPA: hypothetical protein VK617_08485 [Gemmatimonadaceae bacterium]|nr:hypothetical protein [Gemmatimonadaceae bacterium]